MLTEDKRRKHIVSEHIVHERESKREDKKPMEGYEQHPAEERLSEVFGLQNSFDNLSVGMDRNGTMMVVVSSGKEYHAPTLNSDRRLLKGTRRKRSQQDFGALYRNCAAPGESAFGFRANKHLSENRMLREMRRASDRLLSPRQQEAAPFLSLEADRQELSAMRSQQENTPEAREQLGELEQTVARKTELENRFLRRLRLARLQAVTKAEDKKKQSLPEQLFESDAEDEKPLDPPENPEEQQDTREVETSVAVNEPDEQFQLYGFNDNV